MRNIVVRDGTERWEFIHTPDMGGHSSLRLRAFVRPDRHWSLTAEARRSAAISDPERDESREPRNSCPRPEVPAHIIDIALHRAGTGSAYKVWP